VAIIPKLRGKQLMFADARPETIVVPVSAVGRDNTQSRGNLWASVPLFFPSRRE
jgi:hypothetical protein